MMHARQDDFHIESVAESRLLGRAGSRVRAWLDARSQRAAQRQAAGRLARMDAHLLRDIGVSREQAIRLSLGEVD